MSDTQTPRPVKQLQFHMLPVNIYRSNQELGSAAAVDASMILATSVHERGEANVILATGNSQLTFLHALRNLPNIDWPRVRIFHMDEYIGIDPAHPASFPSFLREHFVDHVQPADFFPISGEAGDVQATLRQYEALLRRYPADLVALGWGENGHLAFNDPPFADFADPAWIKVVELDEVSRRQQVGEGHFDSLEQVPRQAITLTIPALLAARHILAIVPEARKAQAVRACLTEPVSEERPGSILREVPNAQLYLDVESASLLHD